MVTFYFLLTLICGSIAFNLYPKSCIDCKFYIQNDKYVGTVDEELFGKCQLFPVKHMVFSIEKTENTKLKKDFMYCSTVRSFNDMCGKNAYHFKDIHIKKIDNRIF